MKPKIKSIEMNGGLPCPKCGKAMQRSRHPQNWHPKPKQPFWYEYWDRCTDSSHNPHMEMYEDARRFKNATVEAAVRKYEKLTTTKLHLVDNEEVVIKRNIKPIKSTYIEREVEITNEMIEAGYTIACELKTDEILYPEDMKEIVKRLYSSMAKASPCPF